MLKLLLSLAVLLILGGCCLAEVITPSTDVLTRDVDGAYLKIFGPSSFYFDGHGFAQPITILNGTALIGGSFS